MPLELFTISDGPQIEHFSKYYVTAPRRLSSIFLRKSHNVTLVMPGCHASLSPLVDTPGCHFDRKREKEENLIRPGIAPARLSRIRKVPGSVL
jgi:hypothetical protein